MRNVERVERAAKKCYKRAIEHMVYNIVYSQVVRIRRNKDFVPLRDGFINLVP